MAKQEAICCRTCVYIDLPTDKNGQRYARGNRGYRCLAPDPPLPPLPVCITRAYGFTWPPSRNSVLPEDGEGCPAYVRREG